jgi:hypothetical protein
MSILPRERKESGMKMNRKGRRAEKFGKVGVERGFGPRHAMNCQEGDEAVPSGLPEPPPEDMRVRANSMGNLRPANLLKALGSELGGLSKEDVAKIGISLLIGGEGELPLPKGTGGVPKVPGGISHLKGQEWLDAYMKKLDEAGMVSPGVQAKQDALDMIKEPPATGKNSVPPPPEPPFEPNVPRYAKGAKGVRKFRGYSPIRARGGEAEHTKVGVEKGFGPRHSANALEGDSVDLTKVPSDTVPAMLTPREAVLNRNASELAGRGNIEALNKEGNLLAQKGVDLAGGEELMKLKQKQPKKLAGGDASLGGMTNRDFAHPMQGLMHPDLPTGGWGNGPTPPDRNFPHPNAGLMHPGGPYSEPPGGYGAKPFPVPQVGQPNVPQGNWGGGGFYPPGQGLNKGYGFAEGSSEVPGGIGAPNPQTAYDPRAQVDFKAPDISGFIKALHDEAKKQGISQSQMGDIVKQFSGLGGYGGGAPGGGDMPYDQLGGQYASFTGGTPGYQGGISEIGYPPFLMPNAEYHADKGSTWEGPYDPQFLVQRYAGGTRDVPAWADPGDLGIDTGPGGFGRPSTIGEGGRSGYINRSSWGGGAPGFPWSPTMIPTTYDPRGYPFAVPVQGPDQNLQGVGRTHNLRHNQ